MAATPKPIRKLSKKFGESNRKSPPIVLKKSPKQFIKKHAQATEKKISKEDKKTTRKQLNGLGKYSV